MSQIGVIAIGRNEGERLRDCLESVVEKVAQVVYVDSGSTDGSVQLARSLNVEVVELDLSIPFTAARARNAGFERLIELNPDLKYVQFVDGDCEVVDGWLERAQQELHTHPETVVVCGRRRERFPEATVYNRLCDIEWNTPIGETKACGGDAMMRVAALQAVGGYNPTLIAGEEPELCMRLRQNGGKIFRLDAEMTLHDAQMTRFSQWWKRSVRAGYAYSEGSWLHGAPPERHWVKETRSIRLWGLIIPSIALLAAIPTKGLSLLLLAGYPLMAYRIYQYARRSGLNPQDARLFGAACMVAKFPQAQGQLRFYWGKVFKQPSKLIEYNTPSPAH
ncbi:MAG: glycosyltransferase family 2 protein [Oscillatoriales cyanobacterium C42_A2020_001]|nr:glycosyltransferase family 2 protein [Leptolyngbyaceae cyanobacterium C42_A2020_001]